MQHPADVSGFQTIGDRGRDLGGDVLIDAPARAHEVPQRSAAHELHDDVGTVGARTVIEHPDDVGMLDRAHCLGLAMEPLDELGVGRERGPHEL